MAVQVSDDAKFVMDGNKKLIVPNYLASPGGRKQQQQDIPDHVITRLLEVYKKNPKFTPYGLLIERDKNGLMNVPAYGSRFEDAIMRAIITGYAIGGTVGGPQFPQLSALVTKFASMAASWDILVTGRRVPRRRAMEVISRANDSQFGFAEFARKVALGFFIDNAGVAVARLPIYSRSFDEWADAGIRPRPIEGKEEETMGGGPKYMYLQPSRSAIRNNAVLETVDIMCLAMTGDPIWPAWIRTYSDEQSDYVWVLCHHTVLGVIQSDSNPESGLYRSTGQSAVWRYLSYVIKDILVQDMTLEQFYAQPPVGFVWLSGADSNTQLQDAITNYHNDLEEGDIFLYPGVLFGSSLNQTARLTITAWRNAPEGFTLSEWEREKENVMVQCLWSTTAQIRTESGRGVATVSELGVASQDEALLATLRKMYESIYNWAVDDTYNRRNPLDSAVSVQVIWKSDRTTRYQIETLKMLMEAVKVANDAAAIGVPRDSTEIRQSFSPEDIRAIFQQRGGVDIPMNTSDPDTVLLQRIEDNKVPSPTAVTLPPVDNRLKFGDVVMLPNRDLARVVNLSAGLVTVSTLADDVTLSIRPLHLRMYAPFTIGMDTIRQAVQWYQTIPHDHERVNETYEQDRYFSDIDPDLLNLYQAICHAVVDVDPDDASDFTTAVLDYLQ